MILGKSSWVVSKTCGRVGGRSGLPAAPWRFSGAPQTPPGACPLLPVGWVTPAGLYDCFCIGGTVTLFYVSEMSNVDQNETPQLFFSIQMYVESIQLSDERWCSLIDSKLQLPWGASRSIKGEYQDIVSKRSVELKMWNQNVKTVPLNAIFKVHWERKLLQLTARWPS